MSDDYLPDPEAPASGPAIAKPARRPLVPTLKPWARWAICGLIGAVAGVAFASQSIRNGALGTEAAIGPWTTGADLGTVDASAKTRAVVALKGLLALPASEARYYNAAVDDTGQPLDARCRYRVSGGPLPARWWSLTLYDADGYLVKNDANAYSLESAMLGPDEQARWNAVVAPTQQPGHWLPSRGTGHVELTLRVYLPADGGRGNLARNQLPAITREAC